MGAWFSSSVPKAVPVAVPVAVPMVDKATQTTDIKGDGAPGASKGTTKLQNKNKKRRQNRSGTCMSTTIVLSIYVYRVDPRKKCGSIIYMYIRAWISVFLPCVFVCFFVLAISCFHKCVWEI